MQGTATAAARQGVVVACGSAPASTGPVLAEVGDTGNALGIALAEHGAATAASTSGALGVAASHLGGARPTTGVVAVSGDTGDAGSVAIGRTGAVASVRSGQSGDAAATCDACSAGTDGLARALSGDTGAAFSLAGAGLTATATARTGDSGDADATAHGTGTTFAGGTADGRSGDTGDALAAAVDLTTWVSVTTDSGRTGWVTSVTTGPAADRSAGHTVDVGPAQPGHRHVRTGHATVSGSVGGGGGARSQTVTGPAGPASPTAAPAGHARPSVRAPASTPAPTLSPSSAYDFVLAAQHPAEPTSQQRHLRTPHTPILAAAGLGLTLLVVSAIALLAAVSWLRRGRSRR
jgi:hypothetical protein